MTKRAPLTGRLIDEAKLDTRTAIAALKVLSKALGLAGVASLVAALALRRARGEPFADLEAAGDLAEIGSRKQAGDAFLLYRVLAERMPAERAAELTKEVMLEGGAVYLGFMLGAVVGVDPRTRGIEENETWLVDLLERFPNTKVTNLAVDATSIRFEVEQCRFVELAETCDHPGLAECFCACDSAFFRDVFPEVAFARPQTLAGGASHCVFEFSWKEQ